MKKLKGLLCSGLLICLSFVHASAQSEEIQQLLLDLEKLKQLKTILSEMYKGYEIVSKGYSTVRDLSEGNFDLHKNFLDGLLDVSPTVRHYKKIADAIGYQLAIIKEYKSALAKFRSDPNFTSGEISYIKQAYDNLIKKSAGCLDELIMIITGGALRMTDDERLSGIDHVFNELQEQFIFLKNFTNSTALLSLQRSREKTSIDRSRKLLDIK